MRLRRLFQTLQLGMKCLFAHKLRSGLTILGVVFGVASVIVMLAVGEGAKVSALRQIRELGSTNIILRSIEPTDPSTENQSGAIRYGLLLDDLQRIHAEIPSVAATSYTREHRRQLGHQGRKLVGQVVGVSRDDTYFRGIQVASGRFISDVDHARTAPVVVLGAQVASTLFPVKDPLGEFVLIGSDVYFQVVGTLLPRGSTDGAANGEPGDDQDRNIYIPFSTDRQQFGEFVSVDRSGLQLPEIVEISRITIAVDKISNVKATAQLVESIVHANHPKEDVLMTVPLELLESAERTQRMFTLVLGSIASISLIVGGIGIMNIMLATVTERTHEIGIRRAIGARRADITQQFVIETVVLSALGGLLGVVAGLLIASFLPSLFDMRTVIRGWVPSLAFGISVAVGVIFGAYPARRAAAMDPIQALRHD